MLIQGIKKHWAKAAVLVTLGVGAAASVVTKSPYPVLVSFLPVALSIGGRVRESVERAAEEEYTIMMKKVGYDPNFPKCDS